ncbi:MAG: NAD(P)-dependent alcohol dehydrogenase [Chloroflexi bacterium]|nr:NAD(P)-dependent alcohol dehydrogenase [Chloroflexota bacterium]MCC6892251.1 NAD(P)-dependent alcohol dehydrogenase [Anaerolineae bacterium]
MKAIVYTRYGSPDVLHLTDVPMPVPKDNEVRIKIHAANVTPTDCASRKADPFITRFMNGLLAPKNPILGNMLAGEVEAVGKDVTRFKIGDRIFGSADTSFGTHAEYMCLPETGILTAMPNNMSYEEAVNVPEALTPLYFLRELANLQPGQQVLINGASGALGTYGVQLAKHLGAEVTGVCSTANIELVKSLGADEVIDYTKSDFTKNGQTYDVIFDAVGKSTFGQCKNSLKQGGLFLFTVPTLRIVQDMLWTSRFGSKKAVLGLAGLHQKQENLQFLKELVEAGKLKSVIDRCYPLAQTAEAHRYVDTGRKKGNVVIEVTPAT